MNPLIERENSKFGEYKALLRIDPKLADKIFNAHSEINEQIEQAEELIQERVKQEEKNFMSAFEEN